MLSRYHNHCASIRSSRLRLLSAIAGYPNRRNLSTCLGSSIRSGYSIGSGLRTRLFAVATGRTTNRLYATVRIRGDKDTMTGTGPEVSSILQRLQSLKLSSSVIHHAPAADGASWHQMLSEMLGESNFAMTKSLAFKPSSKAGPVKLVMVVAQAAAETKSSHIAKLIGFKDMRMASPELIKELLGVDTTAVSPLSLLGECAQSIKIVIDESLKLDSRPLTFRAGTDSESILLSFSELQNFLEDMGVTANVLDLSKPQSQVESRSIQKPKRKEPAKSVAADASTADSNSILIGITTKKSDDFARWYQEVLLKSEMIDYYDVSGCYVLRPWSFQIWEFIQGWFDTEIKKLGVSNAYFPMFISARQLEKEKDHIEGFSPEVAWITHAGKSKLEEAIALRPTSETAIYPYYAKWIRSHRDLPLRYNQWSNVVRWEFKSPQPFIRTREFLWQEGHTVHLTKESSLEEVFQILDLYAKVYTDLLAVPVVKGIKSENERFAGADMTTSIEGYIATTGRGIQLATSHSLGQNFSKMFNIAVEDPNKIGGEKMFTWQNSWGISTRTIGVMIMVHGDDKGLRLPPAVAKIQVIIVPCGLTSKLSQEKQKAIEDECLDIESQLKSQGIRAYTDLNNSYTPGWKFSQWEMKGVPLRIEFGPQDFNKGQITTVRRDTGEKGIIPLEEMAILIPKMLTDIQKNMYLQAELKMQENIHKCREWSEIVPSLNSKKILMIPWCNTPQCEDWIKENSKNQSLGDEPEDERAPSMGAKSLCNPIEQPEGEDAIIPGTTKCIACGKDAKLWGLFGRSY